MARDNKGMSVRRSCNAETQAASASEAIQAGVWFKQKGKEKEKKQPKLVAREWNSEMVHR